MRYFLAQCRGCHFMGQRLGQKSLISGALLSNLWQSHSSILSIRRLVQQTQAVSFWLTEHKAVTQSQSTLAQRFDENGRWKRASSSSNTLQDGSCKWHVNSTLLLVKSPGGWVDWMRREQVVILRVWMSPKGTSTEPSCRWGQSLMRVICDLRCVGSECRSCKLLIETDWRLIHSFHFLSDHQISDYCCMVM